MKKILYFILYSLIIIFLILIYGRFVGTTGLKTNNITLKSDIVQSYNGLKIIHFSDLHYKKVITEKRVKELIQEINKNTPDIVLFTGDLLDKDYTMTNQDINFLIEQLSKIESKYGNFAILGDSDKPEEETLQNIYIQSNFTLLKNEGSIIHNENNDKILIGGLDSYLNNNADIDTLITNYQEEDYSYSIILIHEPDYIPTILEKHPTTSLILAGHSIDGSIRLPIIKTLLLPNGAKNYYNISQKEETTDIYISNGIGVNNINFRLFNTPSINLYRIKKN